MKRFNGVSTKYLQNYLNWFLALEKVKMSTEKLNMLILMAFSSNKAWYKYQEIINSQLKIIT